MVSPAERGGAQPEGAGRHRGPAQPDTITGTAFHFPPSFAPDDGEWSTHCHREKVLPDFGNGYRIRWATTAAPPITTGEPHQGRPFF